MTKEEQKAILNYGELLLCLFFQTLPKTKITRNLPGDAIRTSIIGLNSQNPMGQEICDLMYQPGSRKWASIDVPQAFRDVGQDNIDGIYYKPWIIYQWGHLRAPTDGPEIPSLFQGTIHTSWYGAADAEEWWDKVGSHCMQDTARAILSENSSAKNVGTQDMEGLPSIQSTLGFGTNKCLGTRSSTTVKELRSGPFLFYYWKRD